MLFAKTYDVTLVRPTETLDDETKVMQVKAYTKGNAALSAVIQVEGIWNVREVTRV